MNKTSEKKPLIPEEIWALIFSYLEKEGLKKYLRVNKTFAAIILNIPESTLNHKIRLSVRNKIISLKDRSNALENKKMDLNTKVDDVDFSSLLNCKYYGSMFATFVGCGLISAGIYIICKSEIDKSSPEASLWGFGVIALLTGILICPTAFCVFSCFCLAPFCDDKAQENLNFCCNLFKQAHVIHRQNIVIEELRDIETRWKDSTEMNPYGLKYN